MSDITLEKLNETTAMLNSIAASSPLVGIILGSGLGSLADHVENPHSIPYTQIPHFPTTTVEGHRGQLVFGTLEGISVVLMQGRFHYYEGYSMEEVIYPVRTLAKLGIKHLVVTNAAGGIQTDFSPGDLMVISDHINLLGVNPLRGPNVDALGQRFPDMSAAYSPRLQALAFSVAESLSIQLQKGVYASVSGPSYETPAEIRYLRAIGADAVGMSTVPEVIAANHIGLDVLGISCITNMAAGVLDRKLSHDEVVETADRVKDTFVALVKNIVRRI